MLYHRDSRNRQTLIQKNSTLFVLVAMGAFMLLYTPVRGALMQIVYSVAPSAWVMRNNATDQVGSSLLAIFRSKEYLMEENARLVAELERMQAQVLDRNLLEEKVLRLEELSGRAKSDNRVFAEVIVDRKRSPYDILIIDAGEDEGISVGNMVVYAGSGVVGEVAETTASSAKVKLFSSPGNEVAVAVGPSHVPATAFGKGLGNFEAKLPQGSAVVLGDTVLSVKDNLILGAVSSIEENPEEPFKRIFFREPFNITEMQSVEVIIDNRL